MSTSSVHPLPLDDAFDLAQRAGFDGMEIMVTRDPRTRDVARIRSLSEQHGLPVLSVHVPVLPGTELLWGLGGASKLERTAEFAAELGAETVVVHPAYRWQVGWGRTFETVVRAVAHAYGLTVAVENMFALGLGSHRMSAHATGDVVSLDVDAFTLDFSHAAADGRDSLALALAMGDRLRHVHLCDGHAASEGARMSDEHLIPGRGGQPVGDVIRMLDERDWDGVLVAEVSTRAARDDAERLAMLSETVRFTRSRCATPSERARRRSA